ncbi:hypothetical protein FRC04_009355 [Tulasnella sp. 424]|nr:hypothetical protein FRC04_009355 [Tulasnella sp. 424]KAG8973251.1 hypothetical protein FRC05_008965 [Tulasnella sp. 425]
MPQMVASTSAVPPPHYHQQPLSVCNNLPPQKYHLPAQNLGQFDDISPALTGKAFIYDCMVRALESLSPDGASVKEIFDNVWLHNRAFILARSREGDTESSRRASTRNTIVNYLSTSPAFENIGRNRWVLTGKSHGTHKRHGTDTRGGKISRSTKRLGRPRNASFDDLRGANAAAPSSTASCSSPSAAGNSSSSSPAISNLPDESAPGQTNESHNFHLPTSAPFPNNLMTANRSATAPLPLSNGLTQASLSSTPSVFHHMRDPELHVHHRPQQHHQRQEGPIVSSLSSHAAPLDLGMISIKTVVTGHPQRENFLYGQPAHGSTNNTAGRTVPAPTTGCGRKRSFEAVPQVLPPRPPRTWHPDNLDPFVKPIQTPNLAPAPTTTSTTTIYPPFTAPSGRLFQIPSNTSYYEAPSVPTFPPFTVPSGRLFQIPSNTSYYEAASVPTSARPPPPPVLTSYTNQEHNLCATVLLPPSSSCHPSTREQVFTQVDHQGGWAGNSIPVGQQHYDNHHQQQIQGSRDHDPFANPPGLAWSAV